MQPSASGIGASRRLKRRHERFEMAHRFIYDRADLGIGDDDKVFDEMNEVAAEFEAVASKLKAVIEARGVNIQPGC